MSVLGHWREPEGTPVGAVEWRAPDKGGLPTHTASIQGKLVALVKGQQYRRGYTVWIEGWMWTQFPEGAVDAKLHAKESPLRGFANLREAKKAVVAAMALLSQAKEMMVPNDIRRKLTALEVGQWLNKRMAADPETTLEDVAALIGQTEKWCRRVIRIADQATCAGQPASPEQQLRK